MAAYSYTRARECQSGALSQSQMRRAGTSRRPGRPEMAGHGLVHPMHWRRGEYVLSRARIPKGESLQRCPLAKLLALIASRLLRRKSKRAEPHRLCLFVET
jgi:hypothetical protein